MTAEIPHTEVQPRDMHANDSVAIEPVAIRCIVVPLDGSPLAEGALPVAIALAKASGATVRAVHIFVPLAKGTVVPGLFDYAANVEAQLANEARAYVRDVRRRFQMREGALESFASTLSRRCPSRARLVSPPESSRLSSGIHGCSRPI